jgi:hypothetical protein
MRGSLVALALASMLGLTYNSLILNNLERRAEDIAGRVAELKQRLPRDQPLVSLNLVHHVFAYHYGDRIDYRPVTTGNDQDYTYFCFFQTNDEAPHIPFAWQLIDVISCDRHKHVEPTDKMIIGRKLDASQAASSAASYH